MYDVVVWPASTCIGTLQFLHPAPRSGHHLYTDLTGYRMINSHNKNNCLIYICIYVIYRMAYQLQTVYT